MRLEFISTKDIAEVLGLSQSQALRISNGHSNIRIQHHKKLIAFYIAKKAIIEKLLKDLKSRTK